MYSHSGLLLSNEKTRRIVATTRMILRNIMLAETYQIQCSTHRVIHLNEVPEQGKLTDDGESEQWLLSCGEKVKV